MTELRSIEINGKSVAYHDGTRFHVQVGQPGRYVRYKTSATFIGNPMEAAIHFNRLDLDPGFRARLVMEGGAPRPVIAKRRGVSW
jgi:hypothetical protein